jgi:hypothetical protein
VVWYATVNRSTGDINMKFDKRPKSFLTFLHEAPTVKSKRHVTCLCVCGNQTTIREYDFRKRNVISCGCKRREIVSKTHRTHGMSLTKIYRLWAGMHSRCYVKSASGYADYGARGIKVCERWHDFAKFYKDMGERPEGCSLERLDNNGDYTPDNCTWSLAHRQHRNTRATIRVQTESGEVCLKDYCHELGVSYSTVLERLKSGYSMEAAISKPLERKHFVQDGDKLTPLADYCRAHNITYGMAIARIYKGWTPEDAVRIPKGAIRMRK